MGKKNLKYILFLIQLFSLLSFAQQKSAKINLPLSTINQKNISTPLKISPTTTPIDTLPLFLKAKDSVTIDSIVLKRIADSLILLDYNEKSKFIANQDQSINIPAQPNFESTQNTNAGYIIKPIPNPFEKDTTIISPTKNKMPENTSINNDNATTPPANINPKNPSPAPPSETIKIEELNSKPSRTEEVESIRKYYKNRRYATGYVGVGYNMSLVDVCGGIRLYQFNNLPIYFEIDLFFNSFVFKKFVEPIFVYRVMPSINVGYTYEFSDFLNGVGLSASAGVGPYHEGYSLLTDVGFEPLIRDQRFIKFAWDWAIDATFSLDKEQKYRLMLKHKMMYLTKSNFGNTIQSISVNMLFRLDYRKVEERRKVENIYLNY